MATMYFKLAGISTVLAALFVVALEVPSARGDTPQERPAPIRVATAEPAVPVAKPAAPEARPAAEAPRADCRRQAWPYVDPSCMSSERRSVRTISIDAREARNSVVGAASISTR